MDIGLISTGLLIGVLVGLIGMSGGALLIPMLVLFFQVSPLTAVSSGLLVALVMKPLGAAVHMQQRTVHWGIVRWLAVGSMPAALVGAMVIGVVGHTPGMENALKLFIGITLCLSVGMTLLRQVLDRRQSEHPRRQPEVRPLPTMMIGAIGGFAVGMTSVGAGSLIVASLLVVYPELQAAQLIGTDIVQAVPLVAAATVAHLHYGDVHLALTSSLLLGALPGVYLGARFSTRSIGVLIRPTITIVLLVSALVMLQAPPLLLICAPIVALIILILLRMPPQPAPAPAQADAAAASAEVP
ncbi:MAG: sulfite exporter TauE/SafE family protein [Pseudonocardiales bacterium]|nr:sulfite exporter TauE/SafE family protein [Pseudonocardiales bacterium]